MPSRIIREGMLTSSRVQLLSVAAEVFYRRLQQVVDDYGLFDGRIAILRASLYPLRIDKVREKDVENWLKECVQSGLVHLYNCESKPYVCVLNFNQQVRSAPKYPIPPGFEIKQVGKNKQLISTDKQLISTVHLDGDGDGVVGEDEYIGGKPPAATSGDDKKKGQPRFKPPGIAEVILTAHKVGLPETEAHKFHAFYESKGWMVGKNKMKSWVKALAGWKVRYDENRNGNRPSQNTGTANERAAQEALKLETSGKVGRI